MGPEPVMRAASAPWARSAASVSLELGAQRERRGLQVVLRRGRELPSEPAASPREHIRVESSARPATRPADRNRSSSA